MNKENKYLADDKVALELIAKLESINEEDYKLNQDYNNLEELIEKDFLELANYLNLLGTVKFHHDLVKIKEQLVKIINFSYLAKKKIVAVAGQFGVGKSSLVNNLLGKNYLPTGIEPVTSLETYITKGNSDQFLAYNIFDKKVKIEQEAFEALSYDFYQKYNLSFTQMIKNIIFKTVELRYENLVLLDLPGFREKNYYQEEDNTRIDLYKKGLNKADYLIWVLDINNRGVPKIDIQLLKELDFSLPIFFILNKADKERKSRVKRSIGVIRKNLKASGIKVAGIKAFSAKESKVYFDDGLNSFLESVNKKDKDSNLVFRTKKIFEAKINLYQEIIDLKKKKIEKLNEINLLEDNKKAKKIAGDLLAKDKKRIKEYKHIIKELKDFEVKVEELLKEILAKMEINYFNSEKKEQNLFAAIKRNDFFLFRELISEVDLDLQLKEKLLTIARKEGSEEIIDFLESKEQDTSQKRGERLLKVIKEGDIGQAKGLIKKGTDINIRDREGRTPLMRAVYYDFLDLADKLIKQGGRTNIKDEKGNTALTIAMENGSYDMVNKLVQNGANLYLRYEFGRTTLMKAVLTGDKQIVKLLIEAGANPDLGDNQGTTALMLAVQKEDLKIIETLLEAGASFHLSDDQGNQIKDYARRTNNSTVMNLIQTYS